MMMVGLKHGQKLCNAKLIIRARSMGLCFGVRDALKLAFAERNPQDVTIHGELVHNEEVLSKLRSKGYTIGAGPGSEELVMSGRVMITAHGISDKERARLEHAGGALIDTTCLLVQKVHAEARTLEQAGCLVLVIGKPGHVEVLGITGDLGDCRVLSNVDDVERYAERKLGVICQTTFQQVDAEAIVDAVRRRNPEAELRYVDSTCEPTRQRIAAVRDLIAEVEVLIVVGGKNSNNSLQQVRMAEREGTPAFLVQAPNDLCREWFVGKSRIGLSAGTSTMNETIDAVEKAIGRLTAHRTGH